MMTDFLLGKLYFIFLFFINLEKFICILYFIVYGYNIMNFTFHFISALYETNRNSYPNQKSHFSYLQKRPEKSTRISSKMDLFRERVYGDVTISSKGKEQHVHFISFPPVWCMHEHSITDACFASDTLIFRRYIILVSFF